MEPVDELVGVYNAEGTVWGELSYWVRARLGGGHCPLCDITHGTFREKSAWQACREGLGVPFSMYHLDDMPDDVAAVAGERTPCVLARTATGLSLLMGPDELAACDGDPDRLAGAIVAAADAAGIGITDHSP